MKLIFKIISLDLLSKPGISRAFFVGKNPSLGHSPEKIYINRGELIVLIKNTIKKTEADKIMFERSVGSFKIITIIPRNREDSERNFDAFIKELNQVVKPGG